jgi:hypothetical protein
MGENATVADNDALWAPSTTYTWQSADQQPLVVSSSADDDGNPVGTGAQTVRVWWLNSANVESTEDVILDGVANVAMAANTVRRINRVEVLTCGTKETNVGNITVFAADGVTVMAYMTAGMGVNDGIIQTVPAGKCDYVKSILFGNRGTQSTRGHLRSRAALADPWHDVFRVGENTSCGRLYTFDVPIPITAGYDYLMVLDADGAAPNVGATLQGWRADA